MLAAGLAGMFAHGQTVVINEVSNGPAGNQEYMELVVVPDGPFDPCIPPPCLDLRGWIVDDNNGYHGAGGVAPGAARFADHPLWTCVPIGTIILIYNGGDPNGSLPPDDVSLNDGNCRIVTPVGLPGYFDRTGTTPSPVLCSNPGGWTATPPNWNGCMAFANTGDCARVTDASGCEVFSVCYGNTTANATIAFAGAGGQRVWWFNNGDPFSPAGWSFGCAGAGSCAGNDQTPGAPNNPANAAWIAPFNNNCTPITTDPVQADANGTDACGGCNGSATAVGSGPSGGYTFAWHEASWTPTGQNTATADALCTGTYHVIVTSSGGCSDTASVQINAIAPPSAGDDASIALCHGDAPMDLFTLLGPSAQPSGSWDPALPGGLFDPAVHTAGAYTYSVPGTAPCPAASATVTVAIALPPQLTAHVTDISCHGAADGQITVDAAPAGAYTFVWSGGLPDGPVQMGSGAGTYTVSVTNDAGCMSEQAIVLSEPPALVLTTSSTPALCASATGEACVEVSGGTGPYSFSWNDPAQGSATCATGLMPGEYTITVTDANGCTAQASVTVAEQQNDIAVAAEVEDISCAGDSDGSVQLSITPPANYMVQWTGPDGFAANGTTITGLAPGNYTYTATDPAQCSASGTLTVTAPAPIVINATTTNEQCLGACDGSITVAASGGSGTWSVTLNGSPAALGATTGLCDGIYAVAVTDANGCAQQTTATIGPGNAPAASTAGPFTPLCSTEAPITLTAEPAGGTWSGPGVVDPTGLFDPAVAGSGEHPLTYTPGEDCHLPASTSIIVQPSPQAAFSFTGTDSPPIVTMNSSSGADQLTWTVHGESVSTNTDLMWPAEDGTWIVCLIVANAAGCTDTACRTITFSSTPIVHVPNAFTPNGDAINDVFAAVVSGQVERYDLRVFDRWGRELFNSSSPQIGWDGTSSGTEIPIGVYPWRLRIMHQQEERIFRGHVTLLR